jgi:hypothetical protein
LSVWIGFFEDLTAQKEYDDDVISSSEPQMHSRAMDCATFIHHSIFLLSHKFQSILSLQTMAATLLDLPPEVLVDHLLPLLSTADLLKLTTTSQVRIISRITTNSLNQVLCTVFCVIVLR